MREWVDERQTKAMLEHSYEISSRDWESTISVDRNAIEDKSLSSLNSVNSGKPLGGNPEPSPLWEGAETIGRLSKEELAYSLLLGDGYLSPLTNGSKNSRLYFVQSIKHKDYVDWIAELCSRFWKVKRFKREVGCGFNNKRFIQYGFRTSVYPFFTHLRKKVFYPENRKRINQRILSKLTPFSLAVWFMDDGSLRKQKGSRRFILCTGGYTIKENYLIKDFFLRKFGIKWRISFMRKTQPFLHCGVREGLKFVKLIKPFIVPSMRYKINLNYQMLNKSSLKAEILQVYPEYKI